MSDSALLPPFDFGSCSAIFQSNRRHSVCELGEIRTHNRRGTPVPDFSEENLVLPLSIQRGITLNFPAQRPCGSTTLTHLFKKCNTFSKVQHFFFKSCCGARLTRSPPPPHCYTTSGELAPMRAISRLLTALVRRFTPSG